MIKQIPSIAIAINQADLKNPNWNFNYTSENNLEKFFLEEVLLIANVFHIQS